MHSPETWETPSTEVTTQKGQQDGGRPGL